MTWTTFVVFLMDYLYVAGVATVLLLVWFAVGEVIDRLLPGFGEYRSNVVSLNERRQRATAHRRWL